MKGGGGGGRENVFGELEIEEGEVVKSKEDEEVLERARLSVSNFGVSSLYEKIFISDFSRRGVEGRLGGK